MVDSRIRTNSTLTPPSELFAKKSQQSSLPHWQPVQMPEARPAEFPPHLSMSTFQKVSQLLRQGQAAPVIGFLQEPPKPSMTRQVTAVQASRKGNKNEQVQLAQAYLALLGHELKLDGDFGSATETQVQQFQRNQNIPVTGQVDTQTAIALTRSVQNLSLQLGQHGAAVSYLRDSLNVLGYDLPDSDRFDLAMQTKVKEFQRHNNLPATGLIDANAALKIQEQRLQSESLYGKSPWHNARQFVPNFAMTAYHESGIYRGKSDPYAVGAVTRPDKSDDLGGKTYGAYQFESYVYPDGTQREDKFVNNSTLMRFVNWPQNPFGSQLKAAIQEHGLASTGFDQVWKNLAHTQNQRFGKVQETFLQADKYDEVEAFFERANLPQAVRGDERIVDLVMGTTNHVGDLAKGAADHLRRLQARRGPMNADQIGVALIEHKQSKVTSWFKSSPGAWDGIRNRFRNEIEVFR